MHEGNHISSPDLVYEILLPCVLIKLKMHWYESTLVG